MNEIPSSGELIPIKSETRKIQDCLKRCLYDVPNFQRPYSWSDRELEQYWEDVVQAQGDFFFGSIVTWVSVRRELFNSTYSIIDGQQRITTSTIILSVLRDWFKKLADESTNAEDEEAATDQANATQSYLILRDDEGQLYPVLKRPEDMYRQYILEPGAIPTTTAWSKSAKQIGHARRYFETNVSKLMSGSDFSSALDTLKGMRSNVLKARVIQVELLSEEDGFLVFETLNTRGKDLRLADLVKNLIIRDGAHTESDRATLASRWDEMAGRIESSPGADSLDRFLWQSWNSRRKSVTEAALFKALGQHLRSSGSTHLQYLEELEQDSLIYARLNDSRLRPEAKVRGARNAFAVPEFVDSVRALAIFDVTVAHSAFLSLARKFASSRLLSQADLIEAASAIEEFHFQYNALTASSSTGGTRSRYNNFSVAIHEASSKNEIAQVIDNLLVKMRLSLPPSDDVQRAFKNLFYAPKATLTAKQKRRSSKEFISYVLSRFALESKVFPPGELPTTWSIEHMKPQAEALGGKEDAVYSIGNLILLTEALNTELSDAPFAEKRESIGGTWSLVDRDIKTWVNEGVEALQDSHLKARCDNLALRAIGQTWAI